MQCATYCRDDLPSAQPTAEMISAVSNTHPETNWNTEETKSKSSLVSGCFLKGQSGEILLGVNSSIIKEKI